MNYFDPKNTAERYAKGRPRFHAVTIEKIKETLKIESKLENALDVACGTGLSTEVLLKLAKNVFGTDTSKEMLKNASRKDLINYAIAKAESQPFLDNQFDIMTVCSGIHWFDIDQFLMESNRLLKTNAHLVIYDNFFISEMKYTPSFKRWFPETYLTRFPSPKRNNNYDWSNQNLNKFQFELIKEDSFINEVEFSKDELILYFTTQSNITDAIGKGKNYLEIENWLRDELSSFYDNDEDKKIICFGNWIKYLKRITR